MVTAIRQNTSSLADRLFSDVYEFSFPQAVRILNKLNPNRISVGYADDPRRESVWFSSHITLGVSSSDLHALTSGSPPTLTINFLGIAGIQGPLPDVFTEIIMDRSKAKDTASQDFLDVFNHRLIGFWYKHTTLLYPCLHDDPLKSTPLGKCLMDMAGVRYHDDPSVFLGLSTIYWQKVPSLLGLEIILQSTFKKPIHIVPHQGVWNEGVKDDYSILGKKNHRLGVSSVLGKKSFQQNGSFVIEVGPLSYKDFMDFLPKEQGSSFFEVLQSLVAAYFSFPPRYKVCLKVEASQIPPRYLKGTYQLGRNTWLGKEKPKDHKVMVDLCCVHTQQT